MNAMVFVLHTGCQWNALDAPGQTANSVTCAARRARS